MQLGQLLAAISAPPASSSSASTIGSNADAKTFSKMLGDAEAKNTSSEQGKQAGSSSVNSKRENPVASGSATLAARTLNGGDADDVPMFGKRINRPITSDEAAVMLARLEANAASGSGQLRQLLIAIRDGKSEDSLGSLVRKLIEANHAETSSDISGVIQQALRALLEGEQLQLRQALQARAENSELQRDAAMSEELNESSVSSSDTDSLASVLTQSLQASFFRAVDERQIAADSAKEEREKAREITEIIPLSSILLVQSPVVVSPLQSTQSLATASDTMLVAALDDSRIPSLALPTEAVGTLPEVNLPHVANAAGAGGVSAGDVANSANSAESLESLAALKSANDARLNAALAAAQASAQSIQAASQNNKASANVSPVAASAALSSGAVKGAIPSQPVDTAALSGIKSSTTAKSVVNSVAASARADTSEAVPAVNGSEVRPLSAVMAKTNAQTVVAEMREGGLLDKPLEDKPLETKIDNTALDQPINGSEFKVHVPQHPVIAQAKAAYSPTPVPEQVHIAVSSAIKSGVKDVTIQLDPVDLGRVEVNMHTRADGQTQITFMVDKPSTLDSLARGAHGLERSLQEAGVKTDAGTMQFNLRQQPQSADTNTGGNGNRQSSNQAMKDDSIGAVSMQKTPTISAVVNRNYTLNMRDGLDIRA